MKLKLLYLLVSLFTMVVLLSLYRGVDFSDAAFLLVIASLIGYTLYLISRDIMPANQSKEVMELYKQLDQMRIQKEITAISFDISKLQNARKGNEAGSQKFTF